MASLPLVILHLPFGYGADWSVAAEVMVLATYLAFAIGWDYLWFILNPAYGLRRFRRGQVWWYPGPGSAACRTSTTSPWARRSRSPPSRGRSVEEPTRWPQQGRLVGGLALLCLVAMAAAPAYRRWYRWMRRPEADEHEAVAAAVADREP